MKNIYFYITDSAYQEPFLQNKICKTLIPIQMKAMCQLHIATHQMIKFTDTEKQLQQSDKHAARGNTQVKQTSALREHSGSHQQGCSSKILIKGTAQRAALSTSMYVQNWVIMCTCIQVTRANINKGAKSFCMPHR